MGTRRQIVAFGGGGFSMESGNPLLDDFVVSATGLKRPRVCFLPTASGDADHYLVRFYNAFRNRGEASHISLFRRERGAESIRDHLLSQDLIYVGGGSVISMLGVWRAHGIDQILREAWERGIVLCGLSAGSLCWFEECVTTYQKETKVTIGLGPAIYNPDSSVVSGTQQSEIDTIRANFLVRKLGLKDGPELKAGIDKVLDSYGRSNRNKHRAVVYYLLTRHFGRESVYA